MLDSCERELVTLGGGGVEKKMAFIPAQSESNQRLCWQGGVTQIRV